MVMGGVWNVWVAFEGIATVTKHNVMHALIIAQCKDGANFIVFTNCHT